MRSMKEQVHGNLPAWSLQKSPKPGTAKNLRVVYTWKSTTVTEAPQMKSDGAAFFCSSSQSKRERAHSCMPFQDLGRSTGALPSKKPLKGLPSASSLAVQKRNAVNVGYTKCSSMRRCHMRVLARSTAVFPIIAGSGWSSSRYSTIAIVSEITDPSANSTNGSCPAGFLASILGVRFSAFRMSTSFLVIDMPFSRMQRSTSCGLGAKDAV
mmetsp:Transcript_37387/g.116441  ORF Transcript_37387/g.116441 Transcript_37387/m.116441 type:complete len:210 (-) Transcript_37387:254-883(-)